MRSNHNSITLPFVLKATPTHKFKELLDGKEHNVQPGCYVIDVICDPDDVPQKGDVVHSFMDSPFGYTVLSTNGLRAAKGQYPNLPIHPVWLQLAVASTGQQVV